MSTFQIALSILHHPLTYLRFIYKWTSFNSADGVPIFESKNSHKSLRVLLHQAGVPILGVALFKTQGFMRFLLCQRSASELCAHSASSYTPPAPWTEGGRSSCLFWTRPHSEQAGEVSVAHRVTHSEGAIATAPRPPRPLCAWGSLLKEAIVSASNSCFCPRGKISCYECKQGTTCCLKIYIAESV